MVCLFVIIFATHLIAHASVLEQNAEPLPWPDLLDGPGLVANLFERAVVTADFDGDGFQDVAVAGAYTTCGYDTFPHVGVLSGGYGGNPLRFGEDIVIDAMDQNEAQSSMIFALRSGGGAEVDVLLVSERGVMVYRSHANQSFTADPGAVGPSLSFAYESSAEVGDLNGDGCDEIFATDGLVLFPGVHAVLCECLPGNKTYGNRTLEWFGAAVLCGGDAPATQRGSQAFGDVNNDGLVDFLSVGRRTGSYEAQVFLQMPNQTFQLLQPYNATGIYRSYALDGSVIVAADFNLDGMLDVIVPAVFNWGEPRPLTQLYHGLGNGSFVPVQLPLADNKMARTMLARDLNGDGRTDVVAALADSSNNFFDPYPIVVLFNMPSGWDAVNVTNVRYPALFSLSAGATGSLFGSLSTYDSLYRIVQAPQSLVTLTAEQIFLSSRRTISVEGAMSVFGEFSGDSCIDVAFCGKADFNSSPRPLFCEVAVGNCLGSFEKTSLSLEPVYGGVMYSADFDGDSRDDILLFGAPVIGESRFFLYLSSDSLARDVAASHIPLDGIRLSWNIVLVVDYNRDGAPDIFFANEYYRNPDYANVYFARNLGNATFTTPKFSNDSSYPLLGALVNLVSDRCTAAFGNFSGAPASLYIATSIDPGVVFRNLGNGSLQRDPLILLGAPLTRDGPALANDFDSDGLEDLLVLGSNGINFTFVAFGHENGSLLLAPRSAVDVPNMWTSFYSTAFMRIDDVSFVFYIGQEPVSGGTPYFGTLVANESRVLVGTSEVLPADLDTYVGGGFAVADIDADGREDIMVNAKGTSGCAPPALLVHVRPPPAASTTQSTSASAVSDSEDDDVPLAAILGAAIGGGGLLLVLCGTLALALVFIALCCAVLLVCCVVFAVLVCAIVLVGAVAVAGGAIVSGGGGVAAVFGLRGGGGPTLNLDEEEESVDMQEVAARMQQTNEYRKLEWSTLKFGGKIGEGAYGQVFAGQWERVKVAIKVISMSSMTPAALAEFQHEALTMAKVSHHPNIVTFVGACIEEEHLALVTHFAENGSLDSALSKNRLRDAEKRHILVGCAAGIAFLHSQGIVHRDIAARNVLLSASNSALIADFGYSRLLADNADSQSTKSDVGPVRWMSPESISTREYSTASDVWSFGMLIYEVYHAGCLPYHEIASLADVAIAITREGRTPMPDSAVPSDIVDLLKQLWSFEPSNRPSMSKVHSQLSDWLAEDVGTSTGDMSILSSEYESFSPSDV